MQPSSASRTGTLYSKSAAAAKSRGSPGFPLPNDLAADSYVSVVKHADGAAHLGVWHAILMLASRTPRPYRGWLRRENGQAHDANSISLATRLASSLVETALQRLLDLGLLEAVNAKPIKASVLPSHKAATLPQAPAATPHHAAAEQNRTEVNHHHRTELKGIEVSGTGLNRTNETEAAIQQNAPAATAPTSFCGCRRRRCGAKGCS